MAQPKSTDKRLGSDPLAALLGDPPSADVEEPKTDTEGELVDEFTLDDEICIADVAHWREKFLHCNTSSCVTIDASMVQRVDTAGIQLLLALIQEIQRRNGSLQWREPAESLLQTAATLGLGEALGLAQATGT